MVQVNLKHNSVPKYFKSKPSENVFSNNVVFVLFYFYFSDLVNHMKVVVKFYFLGRCD